MKTVFFAFTMISAAAMTTAADAQSTTAGCDGGPTVVELFTSQSCSSCIAAAEQFELLAARDNTVALAFHVDYWNNLVTSQGAWTDPYSDAAFTERQRAYNRRLRGRSSVYTPQLIFDGVTETVASSAPKIRQHLALAEARGKKPCADAARAGDAITFRVTAEAAGGEAFLAAFDPREITAVKGGENAGRKFKDVNAVTSLTPLGVIPPSGGELTASHDGACALVVQAPDHGGVIAAAYCP